MQAMCHEGKYGHQSNIRKLHPLNNCRDPLPHADAHGCQAITSAAALQLMQQSNDQARSTATEGMTKGDGTAIDVELILINLQFAYTLQGLNGEGLVEFDQIDILDAETGAL